MIPLALAYILNIVDYFFTCFWVAMYGPDAEANPFGRWLYENDLAGFFKIVIVGGLFALLGYIFKTRPKLRGLAYVLLGAYTLVVICHVGLYIYIRRTTP